MKNALGIALSAVAVLFVVDQAAANPPSRCTSTKFKASGKKARSRATCYARAVARDAIVDSNCLGKASAKFSKSFAKAETQSTCNGGTGDSGAVEMDVDDFVDQVRTIVNSQGPGPSTCDSKKIKASGRKASSKAKCHAKAARKGTLVDNPCLSKAETKFSKSISKAEFNGGCTHTGQTNALESAVNAFIDELVDELNPTTTTTTTTPTTSSTTTSTLGPRLFFTTTLGTTSCGSAGLTTGPSAPVSGELDSDTAATTKIVDLGLGCLYFGGGNATVVAGGAIPDGATQILGVSGGNTLVANPGTGPKTCTLGAGPGKQCINNNSTPSCTNDTNCGGSAGSCGLVANCYFGPPLPIVSPPPFGSLTTCVLNAIQSNATGTVNLATGDSDVNLNLSSRVYITGNTASPCPKCLSGSCDPTWKTGTLQAGPDAGKACSTLSAQQTTIDCRPSLPGFQAALAVNITPLTTGLSVATDAAGNFCPQNNPGAFGQSGARAIQQQGMAAGDLTDGLPHNAILGYNFCIPATGAAAVDGVADLPGPGSLGLNGESQYVASPSGAFVDASVPLP